MTVHVVSTDAEIADRIRNAANGDVIRVRGGKYASLKIWTAVDPKWSVPVTITADDPANKPEFKGLGLAGAVGVKITDVIFRQEHAPGTPQYAKSFEVNNSENVEIAACAFIGHNASGMGTVDDGYGTGWGLFVNGSKNVILHDNTIETFQRAAVFSGSQDISVVKNTVRDMSSDGLNFAGVQQVKISENSIGEFRMHPDSKSHPDCIQFWSTGQTVPSTDIDIGHNRIFNASPSFSQSIFMRNEVVDMGQAGDEMFYRNVRIHNNVIFNSHLHGITVGETDGLVIENNTLVNAFNLGASGMVSIPVINVNAKCRNVKVRKNIQPIKEFWPAWQQPPMPAEWVVSDFSILQREDPAKPNFYGSVLQNPLATTFAWANFLPKAGTREELLGIGARPLVAEPVPTPTPTPTPTPVKVAVVPVAPLVDWVRANRKKGAVNVEALLAWITANQKFI